MLRNIKSQSEISDNTVTREFVLPRTYGIFVEGDSSLKIHDNDVKEYSRVGIFADGDEGDGPDPDVDIRGNTVTGPGQRDPDDDDVPDIKWAPNGIQVSSGATGKIVENTVNDHWNAATGIIIVDSDDVSVKSNSLSENENGIFFGNFFAPPVVEGAVIRDNDLFGGDGFKFEAGKMDNGVWLYNSVNSKVVKNDFDTWADGVDIDGDESDNNKVVNNSFTDVDTELEDDGDNTKNPPNPATP